MAVIKKRSIIKYKLTSNFSAVITIEVEVTPEYKNQIFHLWTIKKNAIKHLTNSICSPKPQKKYQQQPDKKSEESDAASEYRVILNIIIH